MNTYAYLGPSGTFTEAALIGITSDSDQLIPYSNVTAALDAVREGRAEFALVPIENSVEGVVARTLDELANGSALEIVAETTIPVSFALMTLPSNATKPITRIATHPHAESQCRIFIAREYPGAEVITTPSTAAAAEGLKDGNWDGAIAAKIAADKYGLAVIEENIGDNDAAVTRFVLARKPGAVPAPTGRDRTSLVAYIDIDHATYTNPPTYARVIDDKLVITYRPTVTKLKPGEIGTPCYPDDVSVVVSEKEPNIKWSLR